MSKAYLFPGQGSQFVGMGREHYNENATFKKRVDQANEVLGINLKEIMFEGPEEKLKQTEFTQPAIFFHSVALFETLNAAPDMVAGHSLGEFSALVACCALEFSDALQIVRKRGQLMQQAGSDNPGTMAAIIGMDDEAVEIAKDNGCRLATLLPVSGAFHSSLMQSAYDGLEEGLESLDIVKPDCPIYSNYTAKPTQDPEEIRSNVLNQLLNPVRWTQTLQNMHSDGADAFVEVGPGKVLRGLVKRTLKGVETEGYE